MVLPNGVDGQLSSPPEPYYGNVSTSTPPPPPAPPTVPNAPTAVSAVAGNASASVSFTAPSNNGGSAITSYTVTATDITNSVHGGQTQSGTASPIVITGLTNGDSYTFTVTATNAVGTSVASSPSTAVTPTAAPVPPPPTPPTPPTSAFGPNGIDGHLGLSPEPYYGDLAASTYPELAPAVVPPPGNYSISIAGHNYTADTAFEPYRREAYRHRSIPAQRDSLNFDNSSGENVVNTAGLWRRSGQNWILGSGQKFFDWKKASPDRFYTSKGINPWTEFQISLLQDTTNSSFLGYTASGTMVDVMSAGSYTYYMESGSLKFRNGTGTLQTVTNPTGVGTGTASYLSMCHNGSYAFFACGTGGIYYSAFGTTTAPTKYVDVNGTYAGYGLVEWVNDRLWAGCGGSSTAYAGPYLIAMQPNHAAGTAPGTNDVATPNISSASAGNVASTDGTGGLTANWVWTGICQGVSQVYASGYNLINGQQSDGGVYRTAIDTSSSPLPSGYTYPIRALPLAAGEYPTALFGYLNFIFVGTNLGVRMCQTLSIYDPTATQTGDLKSGPIIPGINQTVNLPVTGFVAYKQYVWFTWANYDSVSTGLGRMDLTNFIEDLAPAYASDLMVTGQGALMLDWDYTQNAPLICVTGSGGGVYQQSANLVSSGTITSGWMSWDIPENKTALYTRITSPGLVGQVGVSVSVDYGNSTYIGVFATNTPNTTAPDAVMPVPASGAGLQGKLFNYTLTLTPAGNVSPVINRWQLDALPQVSSETNIIAVLQMYPEAVVDGAQDYKNGYAEYVYLDQIRRTQQIVWYVEGPLSAQVLIESIDWLPEKPRGDYIKGFHALLVVTMKTINGFSTPAPAT